MRKRETTFGSANPKSYMDEAEEWLRMTPAQRFVESQRLSAIYVALGGSLEPEFDPQSPFNFLYYPEARRPRSAHRRPGTYRPQRLEK